MKMKVGIIGCGSIVEFRHAPEYAKQDNVEIAAFCSRNPERARMLADRFGGNVYTDYRELLKWKDIDAVSVCTSNDTHADISVEAFQHGKHVLCEKPMATNLPDARRMIVAARQHERFLMIGHNQRLVPAHKMAKQILDTKELGKILFFNTQFNHGGPESWSASKGSHTWFFKKNSAFAGAMGDLGIHKADLIRWLTGEEITEVCAVMTTRDKKNEIDDYIEVEDNAVCILRTQSGISGSLTASWTNYGPENNSTVLYCEKGVIRINDDPVFPLIVERKNNETQCYRLDGTSTNNSQTDSGVIEAFVDAIRSGIYPEISGEEGLAALRIVLACIQSSETRSFVTINHSNA